MSSEAHKQASLAPQALNDLIISSRLVEPSLPTASIPPASNRFLANVARAVKSAGLPRQARKIFARAPVASRKRSEASRNCSNGCASRRDGSAANVIAAQEGAGVTGG